MIDFLDAFAVCTFILLLDLVSKDIIISIKERGKR